MGYAHQNNTGNWMLDEDTNWIHMSSIPVSSIQYLVRLKGTKFYALPQPLTQSWNFIPGGVWICTGDSTSTLSMVTKS